MAPGGDAGFPTAAVTRDLTIPRLFLQVAQRYGDRKVAMREKEYGVWRPITWRQYLEHVRDLALGLTALGLQRGDKVVLMGDNRPEGLWAEMATLSAGGVCVLAHPGMWGDESSVPEVLIERMTAAGMGGLEADHPDHDEDRREHYRALAERLRVVPTGGSDCHGDRYDPVRLGSSLCDPEAFTALSALAGR